jgi:hypothetical protein
MPEHFSEKWRLGFDRKFRSIRETVSQWWRNGFATKSHPSRQERRGADEAACDSGLSASDLRALASHRREGDSLLRRRMESLHLDANELTWSDPFLLDDLQRLCAMCTSRGACALELEHVSADVAWGKWREYCPNAVTLNELRVRSRMRSNPTAFK